MKLSIVIAGAVIVARKGLAIPFRREDRKRWFGDWFGFTSPEMAPHWARFRDPGPGDDFSHLATNIWTEWNRNDAQRGIKMTLGFGFTGWVLAIILAAVALLF